MTHRLHASSRRNILQLAAVWATPALPLWSTVASAADDSVSALNYGADPEGQKDSTEALNKALANTMLNGKASNAGKVLRIPKGTYIVSGKLTVGSGQRIVFEPGVRIDATRLPSELTSLFAAAGQTDIDMAGNGAELIGSAASAHKEIEGNQAAIFIYGCTNVSVRDFKIRDFATDGITVSGEAAKNNPSRNVKIDNCEVRGCRRNGLSIIYCDGCVVTGGLYASSAGSPKGPWAGIDVEPNANQQVTGVKLVNVRTQDNAGPGLEFVPASSSLKPDMHYDVEVTGGESHNDGSVERLPAVRFANGAGMPNQVAGQIAMRGFKIYSPKSSGVSFTNWDADKAPLALLEDVAVTNPDGTANAHTNETRTAFVIYNDKRQATQAVGNIRLVRCSAEDTRSNPRMTRGGILSVDPGKTIRKVQVVDFTTKNALSKEKYDFSTQASEVPGGLSDTTVEYTKQVPVDTESDSSLHEMGGRGVRATRPGLKFALPPAANCKGLTMTVSAANGVQGTTIVAAGSDRIQAAKGGGGRDLKIEAGRTVKLKSDGNAWIEQ